jgi:hypothetical protein
MKAITLPFLAAGLLLTGCKQEEPAAAGKTNTASGGSALTAPVDYVGAVVKAKQTAGKTLLGAGIDQAIQLYYTETGKFPARLQDLTPQYLPSLPSPPAGMKYDYDPKTGAVKVVPQ